MSYNSINLMSSFSIGEKSSYYQVQVTGQDMVYTPSRGKGVTAREDRGLGNKKVTIREDATFITLTKVDSYYEQTIVIMSNNAIISQKSIKQFKQSSQP